MSCIYFICDSSRKITLASGTTKLSKQQNKQKCSSNSQSYAGSEPTAVDCGDQFQIRTWKSLKEIPGKTLGTGHTGDTGPCSHSFVGPWRGKGDTGGFHRFCSLVLY